MASVFTYDPNPPRVSSPWSTPGRATPQPARSTSNRDLHHQGTLSEDLCCPTYLSDTGVIRLEAEPSEGSTEYKLHLLLRPRRAFLSTSTSDQAPKSPQPLREEPYPPKGGLRSVASSTPVQSVQMPSNQSRQARLQQLTTQLLWRLQQSSPFHSCSTASLVLPNLTEATAKLGSPSKPATLLPGLEESQGALYEIGVSDDGSFVGLAEDELDESLTNLKAMAASLGCVVDVLRKVIVGHCKWTDLGQTSKNGPTKVNTDNLWVVEALVRPELDKVAEKSPSQTSSQPASVIPRPTPSGSGAAQPEISGGGVEQLRISLTGPTNSGKSSLLGTLTTSTLDNGRGKSRLNLLKHRHEIASGVTSSVAQELIGFRHARSVETGPGSDQVVTEVINYASENVSSWNDIHAFSSRLIFLSDSPGLHRYSKSTIRTLISWKPHWTILCFAADYGEEEIALTSSTSSSAPAELKLSPESIGSSTPFLLHLGLCLKLGLPVILVVTKMDIATKLNLRQTLGKLLSVLKTAGKKPALISTSDSHANSTNDQNNDLQCSSPSDEGEIHQVMKRVDGSGASVVPILLTSAVTGQGLGKLRGLLRSLPILEESADRTRNTGPSMLASLRNAGPTTIFQIDEIFAMPPSKVYSTSRNSDEAGQGTVLCGYVSSGEISVGNVLTLGPFLESREPHRLENQSFRLSFPRPQVPVTAATWENVVVVSLRNLRLPTRSLLAGQVGTIGVQSVNETSLPSCDLRRARKGMILAHFGDSRPVAYHTFTASFPGLDFRAPESPPLILGGHATAYINSIRAPVKVTSVALDETAHDTTAIARDDPGIFAFDHDGQDDSGNENILIKFKLLRSVEWMRVDDGVFVVPNAAAVGPITGGSAAATGGLSGFVGRICDLEPS